MRVFKRPRSPYYYFDFDLGGTTHVKSTRLKNERQALDYAAAYRLKLIKRQVGIIEEEKPRVPTFQEFQAQFDAWIDAQHAGKPGTIKFYKSNYQKLLEFEPMRDLALDRIDEAVIERFKFWALRKVGRTTVNRYLATLRKGLRYAWRKLKIIDKAPVIEQYQNERQVEYVFDESTYQRWIDKAEEPLRSQLRHHAGRDAEPRKRLRDHPQGTRRRRQLGRPHHQTRAQAAGPQARAQNQPGIEIGSRKPDRTIQMPLRIQPAKAPRPETPTLGTRIGNGASPGKACP